MLLSFALSCSLYLDDSYFPFLISQFVCSLENLMTANTISACRMTQWTHFRVVLIATQDQQKWKSHFLYSQSNRHNWFFTECIIAFRRIWFGLVLWNQAWCAQKQKFLRSCNACMLLKWQNETHWWRECEYKTFSQSWFHSVCQSMAHYLGIKAHIAIPTAATIHWHILFFSIVSKMLGDGWSIHSCQSEFRRINEHKHSCMHIHLENMADITNTCINSICDG